MKIERVLAIETSCDDTSVAIVRQDGFVEGVCSANQDLAHEPFGGIVPELASRNHTLNLLPLIEETFKKSDKSWSEIHGIAVTSRPGLLGSLLVGVVTAKTLALAKNKNLIGVNHIEGHLLAPFLRDLEYQPPESFQFPYLGLAISGGHTHLFHVKDVGRYEVLGRTVDDAAGEAFDKFAKMLGLGYPGGVVVDRLAQTGNPKAYSFPRGMIYEDNFDFSFSGLKTAAQRILNTMSDDEKRTHKEDLCASFQEAIVDVLLSKLEKAADRFKCSTLALTGGVSANSRLRTKAKELAERRGFLVVVPPLRYCTDNAAMIGYAGLMRMKRGQFSSQELGPSAQALASDYIYLVQE